MSKQRQPGEPGETFTVGVDDVTGRAVMIRNNREVIGGLTREQSITFAQDIIEWTPAFMRASKKSDETEAVNGTPS